MPSDQIDDGVTVQSEQLTQDQSHALMTRLLCRLVMRFPDGIVKVSWSDLYSEDTGMAIGVDGDEIVLTSVQGAGDVTH